MTRAQWTEIAKALAALRKAAADKWPPKGGYMFNAPEVHDRRLMKAVELHTIDQCAHAVCRLLRGQSSRFDPQRFLSIVGVGNGL